MSDNLVLEPGESVASAARAGAPARIVSKRSAIRAMSNVASA